MATRLLTWSYKKILSCCGGSFLSLVDFSGWRVSLSPSPSCTRRAQGEWPHSWSCHADRQFHRDSGSSTEMSQTKHAQRKVRKDYGQLRHGKHHMYSTPVSFVPTTRSQQVLTTRKRRSAGRPIFAAIGRSRWPRTHRWALIFRLKSQNKTDTKAPHHMLTHCAFSVPSWGGAPGTAKIHILGENTELQICTAVGTSPELRRSTTFFQN